VIECAKQRTAVSGNDSLGWEEAHELQVIRFSAFPTFSFAICFIVHVFVTY
jgi:hypothetical protein